MGTPAPDGVEASGSPALNDQANAVVQGVLSAIGPTAPFAFRGPLNLAIWASINTALTTTIGSLTASVTSATGLAIGNAINSVNVPAGTTIGNLSSTTVTLALPPIMRYGVLNAGSTLVGGLSQTADLLGATVTVGTNASGAVIPASTTVTAIIQAAVPGNNSVPGKPGIVQLSAAPTAVSTLYTPVALNFACTGNAILKTGADSAATFTGAAINYSGTLNIERSFDGAKTFSLCNIGSSGTIAQYAAGTPVSLTFGEPEKNVLYRINCIAYTSGTINYRLSQTGGGAESLAIGPLSGG